jgi:hypothetical protein
MQGCAKDESTVDVGMKRGSETVEAVTGASDLPGTVAFCVVVVQAAAKGASMAITNKRAPLRVRPYMINLLRSAD